MRIAWHSYRGTVALHNLQLNLQRNDRQPLHSSALSYAVETCGANYHPPRDNYELPPSYLEATRDAAPSLQLNLQQNTRQLIGQPRGNSALSYAVDTRGVNYQPPRDNSELPLPPSYSEVDSFKLILYLTQMQYLPSFLEERPNC